MNTQALLRKLRSARASCLVGVLVVLGVAASAGAPTVRGRPERIGPGGAHHPATGIAATISSGQPESRSLPAYTDAQGMYYVYNVPAGEGDLEIWVSRDPQPRPQLYRIHIAEPYTDIQPIIVP